MHLVFHLLLFANTCSFFWTLDLHWPLQGSIYNMMHFFYVTSLSFSCLPLRLGIRCTYPILYVMVVLLVHRLHKKIYKKNGNLILFRRPVVMGSICDKQLVLNWYNQSTNSVSTTYASHYISHCAQQWSLQLGCQRTVLNHVQKKNNVP